MGNIQQKYYTKEDRERIANDPIIKQCQFSLSLIYQTAIPLYCKEKIFTYDDETNESISFYKAQIKNRIDTLKETHT